MQDFSYTGRWRAKALATVGAI